MSPKPSAPLSATRHGCVRFADEADPDDLLAGYRLLSLRSDEGYWENRGEQQSCSNWQVLAQRL